MAVCTDETRLRRFRQVESTKVDFCAAIRGEAELLAPAADARRTLAVPVEVIRPGDEPLGPTITPP
jgi:hypothetical protein